MQNKLYKITNILLKIKSYFLVVLSVLIMIFSIIYIFIGQDLINQSQNTPTDTQEGVVVTCSSAFTGGLLKAFGIIFLIASILLLIIGLIYVILTRRMKKQEGISIRPVATLLGFEATTLLFYSILIIMALIKHYETPIVLMILFVITQCAITSYLLIKIIIIEKRNAKCLMDNH